MFVDSISLLVAVSAYYRELEKARTCARRALEHPAPLFIRDYSPPEPCAYCRRPWNREKHTNCPGCGAPPK